MATVNPASTQPKTTTAEDTLQRKSRDASVISGGHLVAKALSDIYQASKAREKRAAGLDPSVGHRVTKA